MLSDLNGSAFTARSHARGAALAVLVLLAVAAARQAGAQAHVPSLLKVALPPDLTVSGRQPPFGLSHNCSQGESAITFHLNVTNIGAGIAGAINDSHAVRVADVANPAWSSGATLPAVPPGATVARDVTLLGLALPAQMAGHHSFTIVVDGNRSIAEKSYANNSTTVAVDFPPGFCQPPVRIATGVSATVTPRAPPSRFALAPHPIVFLPAPENLTSTVSKDVCTAHGGNAGAFVCSIGLSAGKLVLVWDYPYPNAIDGFHVYRSGGALLATQSLATVHLIVLDAQPVGSCFNVTVFKGKDESSPSPAQYCVRQADVVKSATFNADAVGAMELDFYVWVDQSVTDNVYHNMNPSVFNQLTLTVGHSHEVNAWRDVQRKQVAEWNNTLFRGYAHFSAPSLVGHHIAHATLNLRVGQSSGTHTSCVANVASADHAWRPGELLLSSGPVIATGPSQGSSLIKLDITPIVQAWADSTADNKGLALDGDVPFVITNMVVLGTSCVTTYSSAVLEATYY